MPLTGYNYTCDSCKQKRNDDEMPTIVTLKMNCTKNEKLYKEVTDRFTLCKNCADKPEGATIKKLMTIRISNSWYPDLKIDTSDIQNSKKKPCQCKKSAESVKSTEI